MPKIYGWMLPNTSRIFTISQVSHLAKGWKEYVRTYARIPQMKLGQNDG